VAYQVSSDVMCLLDLGEGGATAPAMVVLCGDLLIEVGHRRWRLYSSIWSNALMPTVVPDDGQRGACRALLSATAIRYSGGKSLIKVDLLARSTPLAFPCVEMSGGGARTA